MVVQEGPGAFVKETRREYAVIGVGNDFTWEKYYGREERTSVGILDHVGDSVSKYCITITINS